jgi:transcriptional regulator with XRE-family HTH domain
VPKKATESEIQFGAALKRARQDAKCTQTQAGRALHCSQSKIQKMEAADQRVTDQEVETLLDFYRASEETRLEISALRTLAAPGAPAGTPPSHQFLKLKALERRPDCTEVRALHREVLPVPLQCDLYILDQYELADDPTDKTRVLDERNARRTIFTRDNPPNYRVILSESALLRVPGGSAITRQEQARYLLTSMDEYPHLSVRILPFDAYVAHASTDMVLLRFAAGGPRPAVYLPYWRFGRLVQTKVDFAEFDAYWQTLNDASLSQEASRKYLNNLTH